MVTVSVLAAFLPIVLFIALLISRKPDFVRALIMYMVAKTCFFFFGHSNIYLSNERFYLCAPTTTSAESKIMENTGLSEQCFLVSSFFTYLVLSTLMSMNNSLCSNIVQRMNFSFYAMIVGASFLVSLYLSKLHLLQNSQTVIITSIELGMGFAILFLIFMIVTSMWPIRLSSCFESLPEEELLLNHLCLKWKISTKLSKLEKMTKIKDKLDDVLTAKADIDKRA